MNWVMTRQRRLCNMEENYLKKELYESIFKDSSIFEFVQAGSLDGLWYWDLENPENQWMSPKYWETLGYDPKEKKHLATEWRDIIFEKDLKLSLEKIQRHCEDPDQPYDQIVRYKHKNGFTVWMRCRGMAIRNKDGKPIRMVGANTDITNLKEAEQELSRITAEYERVFNGTQDALFLIKVLENNEFRYVRNNLSHQEKTKMSHQEFFNKTPRELLGDEIGASVTENYLECIRKKESITVEEDINYPGVHRIWSTTLTPIFDKDKPTYIVGSGEDITERKALELKLEKYANYDELTGLPNRRLFFERLERLVLESKRDKSKFALLFLDLDGFKEINDTYGHETGDGVLVEVGKRMLTCVRESDTVARMGGDEFTLIIRHIVDQESAEKIVAKIHQSLSEVMHINDHECNVNSSIGVALYPDNGKDNDTLLKNADSTMYEVKRDGKGGFKFFGDLN